ncbi:MAG: glutaredoxin family protein [Firmicutes bacterium]|nr:glutaredoxin family protein [Bacillota bacterium]
MKEFLSDRQVSFREYNVDEDREAREEMLALSRHAIVPTVVVDGEAVIGFDEEKLDRLLS